MKNEEDPQLKKIKKVLREKVAGLADIYDINDSGKQQLKRSVWVRNCFPKASTNPELINSPGA